MVIFAQVSTASACKSSTRENPDMVYVYAIMKTSFQHLSSYLFLKIKLFYEELLQLVV